MKRKIVKQGTATLTISLPSKWVQEYNLKAGDELNVEEKDKNIIISTEQHARQQKTEINLTFFNETVIRHYLNTAYMRGDDELKINYSDQRVPGIIEQSLGNLIGFAVIEQKANYLVIKDLSGTADVEFDNVLRRIFLLLLAFAEEGVSVLKEGKDPEQYSKRDLTNNKFIYYCLRILNKKGLPNLNKTITYNIILILLEMIGDEYARMYRHYTPPVDKSVIDLHLKTNALLRKYYELFYHYSLDRAGDLLQEMRSLLKKSYDLEKGRKPNEIQMIYRLKKIIELLTNVTQYHFGLELK